MSIKNKMVVIALFVLIAIIVYLAKFQCAINVNLLHNWNIALNKSDNLKATAMKIDDDCWLFINGTGEMISMTIDSTFSQEGRAWRHEKIEVSKCYIYNGCTSIGAKAFSGCSSLNYFHIPSTIQHIDCFAFEKCTMLEFIDYDGTMEMWLKIRCDKDWNPDNYIKYIKCMDGVILLDSIGSIMQN